MTTTLADTTLTDGRSVRATLHSLVCEHMPTTAAASGFVSAVDTAPWVATVSRQFPLAARPADLGLLGLTDWLAERGVAGTSAAMRALQKEWIRERMAANWPASWPA